MFEGIDGFYNPTSRQTALGQVSLVEFEAFTPTQHDQQIETVRDPAGRVESPSDLRLSGAVKWCRSALFTSPKLDEGERCPGRIGGRSDQLPCQQIASAHFGGVA